MCCLQLLEKANYQYEAQCYFFIIITNGMSQKATYKACIACGYSIGVDECILNSIFFVHTLINLKLTKQVKN